MFEDAPFAEALRCRLQSPSLHKLIDCKIQTISHFVNQALVSASEKHTFSVARGHEVGRPFDCTLTT